MKLSSLYLSITFTLYAVSASACAPQTHVIVVDQASLKIAGVDTHNLGIQKLVDFRENLEGTIKVFWISAVEKPGERTLLKRGEICLEKIPPLSNESKVAPPPSAWREAWSSLVGDSKDAEKEAEEVWREKYDNEYSKRVAFLRQSLAKSTDTGAELDPKSGPDVISGLVTLLNDECDGDKECHFYIFSRLVDKRAILAFNDREPQKLGYEAVNQVRLNKGLARSLKKLPLRFWGFGSGGEVLTTDQQRRLRDWWIGGISALSPATILDPGQFKYTLAK